jgi:hypothetical protein
MKYEQMGSKGTVAKNCGPGFYDATIMAPATKMPRTTAMLTVTTRA